MVTSLHQLVRDATEVPVDPLGIFLWCIERNASPRPVIVLPGGSVFGISPMQSQLIMIKDVLLAGAHLRVYLN